jgi:hypothetical protein
VSESQSIFHFPFEIFHLSSEESSPGALVIQTLMRSEALRREPLVQAMANEKSQMENGKWF